MMAQTQVVKKQKMGVFSIAISKSNCSLRQMDITGTGLNNLRSEEKNCDVVIDCGDEKFPAHKLILRAGSAYFDGMFSCGLKEASSSEVSLPSVSARSMAIILDCLYLQNVNIHDLPMEETLDLLYAAHLLQVCPILETCIAELPKKITDDNWDIVLQDAAKYSIECLVSAAVQYLQRCDEWFDNRKLPKLGFDSFYALIANLSENNYYSADILINLIVSWVSASHKTDREKYLLALFSLIDFTSASKDAVNNLLNNDSLIQISLELSNLILKKIVLTVNNSLTPKIASSHSRLLVFRSNSIQSYDFLKGDWFVHNLRADTFPDTSSGMAVADSAVYFIVEIINDDGYDSYERDDVMKIMAFYPAINSTIAVTTCKRKFGFGIVYFNDTLYFTGAIVSNFGFNNCFDNYLESFCLKSRSWKSLAKPIHYRQNPQIVSASDALFVFGGSDTHNLIRAVERYCPTADQWTVFSEIPDYNPEMCALSVVPCFTKIYILIKDGYRNGTRNSKFMEFEPESNTWRELTEYKNSSNNWTLHKSAKPLPFLVIEEGDNYYRLDPQTKNKMLITQVIQNDVEYVKLVIFA